MQLAGESKTGVKNSNCHYAPSL